MILLRLVDVFVVSGGGGGGRNKNDVDPIFFDGIDEHVVTDDFKEGLECVQGVFALVLFLLIAPFDRIGAVGG